MKLLIKIVSTFLLLTVAVSAFTACKKEENPILGTGTELEKEVLKTITEMLQTFDDKKFNDYLGYFVLENEQKTAMLSGFEEMAKQCNTTSEITELTAAKEEEGTVIVAFKVKTTSENIEDKTKVSILEDMHYTMEKQDKKWVVLDKYIGETKILSANEE